MKPVSSRTSAEDNMKQNSSHPSNLSQTLSGYADQAKEMASDTLDETSSFIRKYPGQTLAVGFGLGLALGIVLARR